MCFLCDLFFFFLNLKQEQLLICVIINQFSFEPFTWLDLGLTWKKRKGFVSLLPGRSWEVVMLHRFLET